MSMNQPGGGAAAPAAPPAAPGPGESAAPPAAGGAAPSPGASGQQPPVEQLRQQYETTKSELEPWKKLGAKPEEVQRSHQAYTKIYTEASTLGKQLGYDDAEIQQALESDLAGTLATLRQMAQHANGNEKPLTRAEAERIADAKAKAALQPFQQEREQRLDNEAASRFDGEFDRQFKTSFPNGLPDSNREAISGLAWQLLTDNKDAYTALRGKGDVTAVAKAFEDAKKTFLKVLTDYGEHEKKRVGGAPPDPGGGAPRKKPQSIDDIINNLGNQSVPMTEIFQR